MKFVGISLCILAVVFAVAGIASSLYFLTFGGLIQFIEGCKAAPTNATDIACGALRFLLTGFGIWLSVIAGALTGATGTAMISATRPLRRRY